MPKRERLTEKLVKAAEKRGVDYKVYDEEVRGFALTVYASRNRTFCLVYWIKGRQRRCTICSWPEWSVTAARDRAKALCREIDEGHDLLEQRRDDREAPRVSDLIDRFLAEYVPHLAPPNAADQTSKMRQLVEPQWRNRLVADITSADVERLLTKIAEGQARPANAAPKARRSKLKLAKPTPFRANRVGEVIRKMFTLAVAWRMRPDNPASGFRRRIKTERERFLTLDEIARLAKALTVAKDQSAAGIIRLCMLTGARLGEVRTARFEQFNFDLAYWSKPATTTKQRRAHRLPISADVAALVRQCRLVVPKALPWLFPGDVEGGPVQEIRRFWVAIQKVSDLPKVRINDLRHTFASLLVSGGALLEMIGMLLGHSQIKTTQRYAHLADSPLRAGVDAVAELMRQRPKIAGRN